MTLRDSLAPTGEPPLIRVVPPGPMSRAWLERTCRVECSAAGAFEPTRLVESAAPYQGAIVYASALGSNVTDVDGNRYVDLAAGFGAMLLGHGAPCQAQAMATQSRRLWTSLGDVYPSDAKVTMLERVAALFPSPRARALLCQSGSDAITAALKTAVLSTKRSGMLAFRGSYHGLGYAPLAACGYRESFRHPFARQLNPHVVFASYPSDETELGAALDAARDALGTGKVGAVVVEPILGRGGCVVPPSAFLPALAEMAAESGALLIADEIWTGLGRCGAMLACERVNVVPDILCLGKGLGGGLPISACVASERVMQAWNNTPGVVHTSTFQGYALACATGVATIDAVRDGKLAHRADEVGAAFMALLRERLGGIAVVRKVTGAGLMVGIALDTAADAEWACHELLAKGYIVLTGGIEGNVITITPALTIEPSLLEGFVDTAVEVLSERARR